MDFELSDEQRMLRDSLERLLREGYDFESRRRFLREAEGYSHDVWAQFAELGLLALPFAEEDGGFGGGPVETMIVMEELGRALSLEPYFGGIVLPGALLRHAADADLRARLVPAMAEGAMLLGLAHSEPQARYDQSDVATSARRDGDGWRLNGRKSLVLNGDGAQTLLVSARLDDSDDIALFVVDAGASGVARQSLRMQDGVRAADIHFDDVLLPADALVNPAARPAIDAAFDEATVALCAEAVGAMDEALRMTVDYLKTRTQFGSALGTFQALQHRAADMYVALEQARSMVFHAMANLDAPPSRRRDAVYAAKVQVNESARFVGEQAVQLHGGIAMTEEYKVGHLFKRLTAIARTFADTDHCLDHLAGAPGLLDA